MAANGKSNLAVIHNNLIEYEENAHKSSETLNEVRILISIFSRLINSRHGENL